MYNFVLDYWRQMHSVKELQSSAFQRSSQWLSL